MKNIINFEDWEKLDLVVGEILEVEEIEGADKLYKLVIDLGEEKRIVCVGIKQHYSKEDLEGKKIVLIANLASRKLRGVESQGMVLAACNKGKVRLVEPDKDIEVGSRVS